MEMESPDALVLVQGRPMGFSESHYCGAGTILLARTEPTFSVTCMADCPHQSHLPRLGYGPEWAQSMRAMLRCVLTVIARFCFREGFI